jgi:hypothetical protein
MSSAVLRSYDAGGTIKECFHMRSDLRRACPLPDIVEEWPVGKVTDPEPLSYLELHFVAALGKLKVHPYTRKISARLG